MPSPHFLKVGFDFRLSENEFRLESSDIIDQQEFVVILFFCSRFLAAFCNFIISHYMNGCCYLVPELKKVRAWCISSPTSSSTVAFPAQLPAQPGSEFVVLELIKLL